jgi:hypothetical protein
MIGYNKCNVKKIKIPRVIAARSRPHAPARAAPPPVSRAYGK